MACVWSPALSVGIDLIDSQHRELFVYVDALLRAAASSKDSHQLLPTLSFLGAYMMHHFASEEMLMDVGSYPDADPHKAEHSTFMAGYQRLMQEVGSEGVAPGLVSELEREVRDWLIGHVSTTDRDLGRYVVAADARPTPRHRELAQMGRRH
jgi:hemerythrin